MIIKGIIENIGYVDENNIPHEWQFDCCNGAAALTITEDGEFLYAGYSPEELKKIKVQ